MFINVARPYAKLIAEQYGTDHHELVVEPDMASVVPELVRHYGEPFADSSALPTWYLCQYTRTGVTVALSGDAGDGWAHAKLRHAPSVAGAFPLRLTAADDAAGSSTEAHAMRRDATRLGLDMGILLLPPDGRCGCWWG